MAKGLAVLTGSSDAFDFSVLYASVNSPRVGYAEASSRSDAIVKLRALKGTLFALKPYELLVVNLPPPGVYTVYVSRERGEGRERHFEEALTELAKEGVETAFVDVHDSTRLWLNSLGWRLDGAKVAVMGAFSLAVYLTAKLYGKIPFKMYVGDIPPSDPAEAARWVWDVASERPGSLFSALYETEGRVMLYGARDIYDSEMASVLFSLKRRGDEIMAEEFEKSALGFGVLYRAMRLAALNLSPVRLANIAYSLGTKIKRGELPYPPAQCVRHFSVWPEPEPPVYGEKRGSVFVVPLELASEKDCWTWFNKAVNLFLESETAENEGIEHVVAYGIRYNYDAGLTEAQIRLYVRWDAGSSLLGVARDVAEFVASKVRALGGKYCQRVEMYGYSTFMKVSCVLNPFTALKARSEKTAEGRAVRSLLESAVKHAVDVLNGRRPRSL